METIDTSKDTQDISSMTKHLEKMMNQSNAIPTIRNFTSQGVASADMVTHFMKNVDMVLDGGQLMQAAIQCGKADLVQLYIDKGCLLENPPSNIVTQIKGGKMDAYRQAPYIIQAACHGDVDVFQTLLKANADIFETGHICLSRKKKNSVESNCIGAAAYYGNNKVLKQLLQKMSRQYHSVGAREKIDPMSNKTTSLSQEFMGYTPLMLSVAGPHANLECVKTLLAHQADFRALDKMGNSILHIAALNSQNTILDYLTKNLRMDIFARNNNGETALFICKSQKNKDGVVILEKFQQFDQSRDKTEDLLKELEDQERKEELAKQKKKEKKHRSKIQKLAKEQGVSVEELTKKFEEDEANKLVEEKRRQQEEAEAEAREEQMIREQKQKRIQWEIERKREQERQQAEERRQQILEERKREQEIQKQKDESRAAYMAKRQAERDARRKEQNQNQDNNRDAEGKETPTPGQDKKQKKNEKKDVKNKKEVNDEDQENAQEDDEVSEDEIVNATPQDKKKTGGPVIEGLVGDAALSAMGKRAKKRYLEQKKKEEEEAAALKEAILLKKKQHEQEQRDAIKQKKQQEKDQAKLLKEQEKEQKKQVAEESKKQKQEAKKLLKDQKNKQKEANQEQTNQEKKWKVKQAQSASETIETPVEAENQNQQAAQKVYKKKEKAQSNDKQKKSSKSTQEEKKVSAVDVEVVTEQQPEEKIQVVEKQQEVPEVKQEVVQESVSPAPKSSKKDSRHEAAIQQKIKDLESLLRERDLELQQANQQNQLLTQKCDQLHQENVAHQETISKFNQSQQQLDDVQVDLEDANQLKQQVKTLQTQLLRQNHVNKNLSSQLLETEKKVSEEKKKRTEFETHFEKVINVTQRQKTQDDATVARETSDLVQVQNYLTNIKMRMQQSLDSQ